MSTPYEVKQYSDYIEEHISNVKLALLKYGKDLCNSLNININDLTKLINDHDASKFDPIEFYGYRQWFYPLAGETKSELKFNEAWLHHQNTNPHHPEYWIMRDDKSIKILDMPNIYIAEMLLDWESMSMKFGGSVVDYYRRDGYKKPFSTNTKAKVEEAIKIFK